MNNKKNFRIIDLIKIFVFAVVMVVMTVTGLLWFLRPEVSETEKRELAKFPSLTAEGFFKGDWFSGIETWYADTFPMREKLVNANNSFKALYGRQSEQIVGSGKNAEEIPDDVAEEATLPVTTTVRDGIVSDSDDGEKIEDIYVNGDIAYDLYYFVRENADWYAAVVNDAQKRYAGKADVYSIVVPLNSGVMLSDALQKELGVSSQKDAIDYIYGRMNDGVHKVPTFGVLRNHCDEYIYFRTDHHWTQLGAYYVYSSFANTKGIMPNALELYQKVSYEGFLGSNYAKCKSAKMEENPDTVHAYIPLATNDMKCTDEDGQTVEWKIIGDVSKYKQNAKYSCFSYGDVPIAYAENPSITDGSACVIIKDSFGNAFVPFLIDHYQYVYWLDYRYYKKSLSSLVEEKNITDIIFLQNIYNTAYKTAIQHIQDLVAS